MHETHSDVIMKTKAYLLRPARRNAKVNMQYANQTCFNVFVQPNTKPPIVFVPPVRISIYSAAHRQESRLYNAIERQLLWAIFTHHKRAKPKRRFTVTNSRTKKPHHHYHTAAAYAHIREFRHGGNIRARDTSSHAASTPGLQWRRHVY